MTIAVWLGSGPPARTIRWLDGALEAAVALGPTTAIAAGDAAWIDLANDRALRAGASCAGVPTTLSLDYLGWAQIAAAAADRLDARAVLVDQASRPERFAEVAAIAELLEAVQLTHVVALSAPREGDREDGGAVIHASRVVGGVLQHCRVRGRAVIGVRIAGPAIDEYPTPRPAPARSRLELAVLGLDASVLAHRAQPPRAAREPRRTLERVADHLADYVPGLAVGARAPGRGNKRSTRGSRSTGSTGARRRT